ncbi:MAG: hypothetical protein ACRD4D_06795 [Candidatus Acidiferrales bacterium]
MKVKTLSLRRSLLWLPLLALSLAPPPASASSLRADILQVLPVETGEVAFIDLQEVRSSPHYALLKQRLVPPRFAQFERFISTLGVDADNDLDWLAWALVAPGPEQPSELLIGIVQGQFKPERVQKFFETQKLPTFEYQGTTVYPFGGGRDASGLHFAFLDSSTAVFGYQSGVELFLDARLGAHENLLRNAGMLALINEVNGRSPVWVALDHYYTRLAIRQLLPEAARFPEFANVAKTFQASLMQVEVAREVNLSFQAWCKDPEDAQSFSVLLQAGLAVQSWQEQQKNPALGQVLSTAVVRSSGERLELQLTADGETLQALLKLR